ncbi:MAG: hypothetical protein IPO52_06215 [Gemmatimonadetes bacterium]|nr:hypothetical protein [Gemmatimonadota bacterium]
MAAGSRTVLLASAGTDNAQFGWRSPCRAIVAMPARRGALIVAGPGGGSAGAAWYRAERQDERLA